MAHLARSVATLRIIGDDLVPEEITSLLGAPPTRAERKGEAIPTRKGQRIAKTGGWRLEATAREPEDLDAQVSEILSRLTSNLEAWRTLRERYRLDLILRLVHEREQRGRICFSFYAARVGRAGH